VPAPNETAKVVALPLEKTGKADGEHTARRNPFGWIRHLWRLPVLLLIVALSGTAALYFQPPTVRAIFALTGLEIGGGTSDPIAVSPVLLERLEQGAVDVTPNDVVALGRLLPEGDIITLAAPFGSGDARVASILVDEGDRVAQGDLVATLDNEDQLASALTTARAAVDVRQAALEQTQDSVEASRLEALANRDRAQSALELAEANLARTEQLFERGISSQAALDREQAAVADAQRELERMTATLSRFENGGGVAQADIRLAEQNLRAAEADLARAEGDLRQARVVAPTDGVILAINTRIGERPDNDGVATLADTSRMIAELEVYQADIRRVALGQQVHLSSEALGEEPLSGEVTRIGLEVGRQTLLADDPAANTDARVVDVTVLLDEASTGRAASLSGLEVVARVRATQEETDNGS
jgi:HlyD family secretion protein